MNSFDYCRNQKRLMKSILTQGSAEHNYVIHRHENRNKSSLLYLILLIAIILSLLALPWIQIDSVTTSPGVIAPPVEPIEIRARSTGEINFFDLEENRFVVQGDTLFSIRQRGIKSEQFHRAPMDGYVRSLRIEAHKSIVSAGESILEIQSDSDLVVKCYLSGDKIASLQPEQNVDFLVRSTRKERDKSFSGKITNILPDLSRKDKASVFEVRCSIDKTAENDPKASGLKPGMTLLTRFRLARRSAFDIISKDAEDINQNPS